MENSYSKVSFLLAASLSFLSANSLAADLSLHKAHSFGNYFYTTDVTDMLNAKAAGYEYRGVAVKLVSQGDNDADKPFYRLYNKDSGVTGTHFYTTDINEALNSKSLGYEYQRTEGYTVKSGAKKIYRAYSATTDKYYYTTDTTEMLNLVASGNYSYQKTEGYGK
ncbi:hypothetical protein [Pseudoalteromonas byunsanensis]|uniref:DUF5648 domain-containing protein n=1 Tax=Pseudoalteromonas byunsanensis TaxID=327939 RepID=A0A1S1NAJ2_9GAMM|nr:hypothetical protein [Pseudoalteromonas byunsanensis]OHU96464.1 hypothetical protein BIW53_03810 [Pseudoalteromonas byunsanensis]